MSLSADIVEFRPMWLSASIARVCKLPRDLPLRPGVEGLAIQLLRSIEADELPVPSICSTSKGTVRVTWEHGKRTVMIHVTGPNTFRAGRWLQGLTPTPVRTIRFARVEEMRGLIAWLCQEANQSRATDLPGWEER